MEESQVSITALVTAYARAYHATHDDPKIFDDFLAYHLFTEDERVFFDKNLAESLKFYNPELAASNPDQASALLWVMQNVNGPTTLSRSRYTEDCLGISIGRGVHQYVILGAGMDTFAFRRPEMVRRLQVFEVDHPAMQTFKRNRIAELGWECPAELHFVPVDFTKDNLAAALKSASYSPSILSFFSWLGVTYYLTRDAVFDTLHSIADIAPAGSAIIFDYMDTDAFDLERATKRTQLTQQIVHNAGEPMKGGLEPSTLAKDLKSLGLRLCKNLSPFEIEKRYFQGRTDDYHAPDHVHFAWAMVE